ncbi:autotransporter domain-containing protein [Pseudomonas brassicacearum]|uniref:Autotransporter outer membrane beta-barrel domain-containing protein n=1 Tax=Pseudomonas brassicacearum TaxID=930166 RepID=A0A423JCK3_9PSED|nr:autotransporter domain-containing protein [Pseudomonas brassicacearum]RON35403.1 autotransporter outer membrane beta-barrel domain-containing protein [Pseudomonas brassicacearum]
MPVQHKYKPQHLVLAIAIAIGCAETSMAEQLTAQADSNAKPTKTRKKTATPVAPIGPLELTARPAAPPNEDQTILQAATKPVSAAIEFDDTFYEALVFPEPSATEEVVVAAEENPFDDFQNAYTTQHTILSKTLENIDGVSLQLGEADDLLVINNGTRWDGRIDGGEGKNGLLLNATEGGEIGETSNFAGVRVARGVWTLSHDFNGTAEVNAGAALLNNGSITGDAYVDQSAAFGGKGDVGNLYVDGRLLVRKDSAPIIRGNLELSQDAAVDYIVSATEGASALSVKGTATLDNAGLNVIGIPGNYAESTVYTVLNAGKIEGEFGRVSNNLAFMTPKVSYSDTQVALTYTRNDVPLETFATSASAQALARSVDTPKAVTANAAVTALLASTTETASQAFDQLDGSQNANLAKATLNSDSPISATMLSAMRQLDSASSYSNSTRRNAPRLAAGTDDNGRVWLQALGHGGTLDRDYDALKHTTHGLVLGADWGIDEEWRIGILGGKSETRLDSRGLDGDLDSWHLGAYALRQNGPVSLRLGATYSSHDGSTKRRVAFKGFSDRPEGHYDANTQQAFAELGYNLGQANVSIEPFASLGYQRYQRDTYTEKGGAAALKVHGQTQNNLNSTFGLRLAKLNTLDNGMQLTPRFSAGWKHTYGDVYSDTRQRLVTGGKNFTVSGAPLDRDSLLVDAGLDLGLSAKHTLGVGLTGEIGTDSRNHGITGQWRMSF